MRLVVLGRVATRPGFAWRPLHGKPPAMRMARLVLCEGGPTLMGAMIAGGYIDEMALTVAPMLVSGVSPRITHGASPEQPMEMRLDRVLYGDRSLFLRYLRADD